MRAAAAAAASLALAVACGGGGDADAPAVGIAPGTYKLSALVCQSTGMPPAYPSGAHKAALFAFDDLTAHTLEVRASDATETLRDASCELAVTRTIARNTPTELTLARDRRHVFTPDGCHLHVVVDGRVTQVGRDTTTLFTDATDTAEELPFDARRDPASGATILTTREDPVLSSLWASYGCPVGDRLERRLEP